MPERSIVDTHRSDILSGGFVPMDVRAMVVKSPQVGEHLRSLHESGAQVFRRQRIKTPRDVREIVHAGGNPTAVIDAALRIPELSSDLSEVRGAIDQSLVFAVHNHGEPLLPDQQATLTALNNHPVVAERREKRARTVLSYDRPEKVRKKLSWNGVLLGASTVATELLEVLGGKGIWTMFGLEVAQSTDDIMNIANVDATAKGGSKKFSEMIKDKDNISLAAILASAAAADYFIIPQLLESPSLPLRLAGGALFSFAAFGGTVGKNILHIKGLMRENKKENSEESRTNRFKDAINDHLADSFRRNLWNGIAASFVLSQIAAGAGALAGKDYSGFLQNILGIESIPAYIDLFLGKHFNLLKTYLHDIALVRKSKEPIQIFPE